MTRREGGPVRLSFDLDRDDEDAAIEAAEEVVRRFDTWLRDHPEHADAEAVDVDLVLGWKRQYADGDYGWWIRDHIDDLLLVHFPRKLSASPEEASSIPASFVALFRFLDEQGWLADGSDTADDLVIRAQAQERSFLDAMSDPQHFGMAKRLLGSAPFDLGDEPDQAALDAAMEQFNSLSFEERGEILGLGPPDEAVEPEGAGASLPLPVRPLPSPPQLDGAAADVPLVEQVDALVATVGDEGIKLTKAGNPTLADGRRLVEAVGTGDRIDGIRSTAELPELFGLARIAVQGGAAEVGAGRMRRTSRWRDAAAGERWRMAVEGLLGVGPASARWGATMPPPHQLVEHADQGAVFFLGLLWAADGQLPAEALSGILESALAEIGPDPFVDIPGDPLRRSTCQTRADDVLRSLAAAGIVALPDDEVHLTDGGAALVAPWLEEAGFEVTDPGELADLAAGDLISIVADRDIDPAVAAAVWFGAGEQRAEELVAELAARPEPVRIMTGFTLLEQAGDAAVDALRGSLDTTIGPHAWLYLASVGAVEHAEVPSEAAAQAGIDMFLATSEVGSPADVIESLMGHLAVEEHPHFLDELEAGIHPRTAEVLEQIGRHHPVKSVAKHARKAAHRWRSRHGSGRR